jgi:hypothetical protein
MMSRDELTEAQAKALWAELQAPWRAMAERLALQLAAIAPPEKRAEAERLARIEIEAVLDTLEWPGAESITQGRPNA